MIIDMIDLIISGAPYTLPLTLVLYFGYKILIMPYDYVDYDTSPVSYKNDKRDLSNLAMRLRKIGTKVPPPFPNSWYALAESYEIKPGQMKQIDCLGENFTVIRTEDGKSHVTDSYCPHLGASFANGGVIKDGCIECPFHSWRFDAETGKCTYIPKIDTVPKGLNIKVWTSVEVHGMIHVWYDKDGRAPDWDIPIIDEIEKDGWTFHGKCEFIISAHIQDLIENGADIAHFDSVHTSNPLAGKFMPMSNFWNIFGIHDWLCDWKMTENSPIAKYHLNQFLKIFNKFRFFRLDVYGQQLGAGCAQLRIFNHFFKFIVIIYNTPYEPLKQKLIHKIYGPWYVRPLAKLFFVAEAIMLTRDACIWNQKMYFNNPQLVKTDKCLKTFRNWFTQFYSPNSTPFKEAILGPKKDLIDW